MLLDTYNAQTPEVTIKNTIGGLKNHLREFEDEKKIVTEQYLKKVNKLEETILQIKQSIEAWQQLQEKMNVRG